MSLMPGLEPELTPKSILLPTSNENSETLVFIFVTVCSHFTENSEGQRGQRLCQGYPGSQHPSLAQGFLRCMARSPL